jgi:hypothetical protein
MNEILQLILNSGFSIAAIVGVIGLILNFLLKKFVTEVNITKWGDAVKVFFKGLGIACTLGLSKIPYVKSVWNSILEPYIVIGLRMLILNMVAGFIEGLETDNESFKSN